MAQHEEDISENPAHISQNSENILQDEEKG